MSDDDFRARFRPDVAERIVRGTKQAGFPALLGIAVERVEPGSVVCALEVTDALKSGVGAVHGGAVAALVDHALALAVYPLVDADRWVATTEFKVNYLGWVDRGRLTAVGRVLSLGRQIAVARVDVDNDGRPVAAGQGTLYVRERLKR